MIGVLIPSRGRPENVYALLDSWQVSAGIAQPIILIDEDDPYLDAYLGVVKDFEFAVRRVAPRFRLGGTLNLFAPELADKYEHLGFMGDDHRPRTADWDAKIETALRELGTGLAYGNDLIQGPLLPTAVFMTSDIVQKLGYMVPPGLVHMYMDNFWLRLGRELNAITYLDDVIIEHMHPIAGKAEWDGGYREVNHGSVYATDERTFNEYCERQLAQDLEKLRG